MSRRGDTAFVLPSDIVKLVFPQGTQWLDLSDAPSASSWDLPPNWAPDLFGIAAYLLELAGAYHHVTPGRVPLASPALELVINHDERKMIQAEAGKWRANANHLPQFAKTAWTNIMNGKRSVCSGLRADKKALPGWWKDAMLLAAYADETCVNIGHAGSNAGIGSTPGVAGWIKLVVDANANKALSSQNGGPSGAPKDVRINDGPYSISFAASADVLCVLPKGRTPDIGCTIRSISQNLALLPPAGILQAGWRQVPAASLGPPQSTPFNVLFVPFPFAIDPTSFSVDGGGQSWSWFHLKQEWLPRNETETNQFLLFIDRLVEASTQEEPGRPVNAVLFPEYALNWELHETLVAHIQSKIDDAATRGIATPYASMEFVISGSSSNCEGDKGNFVLTSQLVDVSDAALKTKCALHTSRTKHHRWQINPHQVSEYWLESGFEAGDGSALDPAYWEKINIPRRRIETHQFRDQSILTTLICEDLARAEPVHKYVRAVGPNIIFVLLMDGCQIEQRWSARYAMGLSEDPGSAVVTFTSRGLIWRSNERRKQEIQGHQHNWSVALARNPGSGPRQIKCGRSKEAVLLGFEASPSQELTLDGRYKNTGWTWRLNFDCAVGLQRNDENLPLLRRFVRQFLYSEQGVVADPA